MALVRALTTLVHNSTMYVAGDTFEYAGKLKGVAEEGMEYVTTKSDKAYAAALEEAHKALTDAVVTAKELYNDIKGQLDADPSRGDLIPQLLDAETRVQEAQKAADAAAPSDLV